MASLSCLVIFHHVASSLGAHSVEEQPALDPIELEIDQELCTKELLDPGKEAGEEPGHKEPTKGHEESDHKGTIGLNWSPVRITKS